MRMSRMAAAASQRCLLCNVVGTVSHKRPDRGFFTSKTSQNPNKCREGTDIGWHIVHLAPNHAQSQAVLMLASSCEAAPCLKCKPSSLGQQAYPVTVLPEGYELPLSSF